MNVVCVVCVCTKSASWCPTECTQYSWRTLCRAWVPCARTAPRSRFQWSCLAWQSTPARLCCLPLFRPSTPPWRPYTTRCPLTQARPLFVCSVDDDMFTCNPQNSTQNVSYMTRHGAAQSYLADELSQSADFEARRRLRSATSPSLIVRRTSVTELFRWCLTANL